MGGALVAAAVVMRSHTWRLGLQAHALRRAAWHDQLKPYTIATIQKTVLPTACCATSRSRSSARARRSRSCGYVFVRARGNFCRPLAAACQHRRHPLLSLRPRVSHHASAPCMKAIA